MDTEVRLRNRVLRYLHEAGQTGMTRSEMIRRGIAAAPLSNTLRGLIGKKWVAAKAEKNARGPSTERYFLLIDLTSAGARVTGDDGLPLVPGIPTELPCQRCGRAMSYSGHGRPPLYCSGGCAVESGLALRPILDRAHQSNTFAHTCTLLVAADLLSRGFRISLPILSISPQVAVFAVDGEVRVVQVLPINLNGKFPPTDCQAWAKVFRDGRIEYGGSMAGLGEEQSAFAPNAETADVESAEAAAAAPIAQSVQNPVNESRWCSVCGEKRSETPAGFWVCENGHAGADATDDNPSQE